jgi:DNA-binding CsgD family transcriptional regulator
MKAQELTKRLAVCSWSLQPEDPQELIGKMQTSGLRRVQLALDPLREAASLWRELGVPYELARVGVLIGLACRALADHDGAALEFEAARRVFEQLGARPDVVRLAALSGDASHKSTGLLTARETEVLGLLATGQTNRAIAQQLRISEKTVARHLSNIFNKLGVSTRSAATAYAYRHQLTSAKGA